MADPKRKRSDSDPVEADLESSVKRTKVSLGSACRRKKAPGFSNEIFNETSCFFRNGLRYVEPYYFTFESFAKGRWTGRSVFDVFSKEFQSEKPEYYKKAIEAGKITVGGIPATMNTVIERNTLVCHKIHRHEPPVVDQPLKIIHHDDQMVVIDKPPSIPVHPCGRYRHNTVVFILAKEYNIRNLHTIHRLDRLTSGILMFSKSLYRAQQIEEQIREKKVTKTYLARVKGEFPEMEVECNEPIIVVSHKLGVCHVDPGGKPCSTSFKRLLYDGHTSLVRCVPKTGRMHQIRVHLQWLGYPILNDPLYNHSAWGPERGRGGQGVQSMEEVLSKIVESRFIDDIVHEEGVRQKGEVTKVSSSSNDLTDKNVSGGSGSDVALTNQGPSDQSGSGNNSEKPSNQSVCMGDGSEVPSDQSGSGNNFKGPSSQTECSISSAGPVPVSTKDPDCTECQLSRSDPAPSDLIMYLHALNYSGKGWEYSTDRPHWASKDWTYHSNT